MCWKCGNDIDSGGEIFRASVCPDCGADLHCCRNCRLYSAGSHYDCAEPDADFVTDKEKANFCGYFSARLQFGKKDGGRQDAARDAARRAFAGLFGGACCL